jgi:hypothetical protein
VKHFKKGQRVQWKTRSGTEEGTILDVVPANYNLVIKQPSYMLQMDFNGQIVACPVANKQLKPVRKRRGRANLEKDERFP